MTMGLWRWLLAGVPSCLLCAAAWADTDFGGTAKIAVALDKQGVTIARLELLPGFEYRPRSGVSVFGKLRARTDLSDDLLPGSPAFETFGSLSRPVALGDHTVLELRDLYLQYENDNLLLRVGKQQIVWGQLDGYKLLDQVNPQSYEEFILEDFDQSRIGLWSFSLEFQAWGGDVQLVAAPDPTVSFVPEGVALFAPRSPRFRFGHRVREGSFCANCTPIVSTRYETPSAPIKDGVYGARLLRYIGGWDLSFSALTGPDHIPLGRYEAGEEDVLLTRFHKRRTLFGATATTSFGPAVFRSEIGYFPGRSFNAGLGANLGVVEADQLTVAAALDVGGPAEIFLSAQLIYDDILDAPTDLVRPERDILISLYARRMFWNDTLKAEMRWYAASSRRAGADAAGQSATRTIETGLFSDGLVRATLEYQVSDQLAVTAGFDWFYGRSSGIYGQFDARDRFTISLTRYF